MSFESIVQSIVDDGKGVLAAALIESDGIPIVQVHKGAKGGAPLNGDIAPAAVEFGRLLNDVAKAGDSIGGGAMTEAVFCLARLTLIFSRVEDDIMLMVAIAPDGNLGQARYLIRRSLMAVRQEL